MPFQIDRLVFPAFRTPAGLTAQSAAEHRSDYAEAEGQAEQLDRRTNGVWRDVPFSPGLFNTDTGALWTPDRTTVFTYRYRLVGPELFATFLIIGPVSAASNFLYLGLPEGLKITRRCDTTGWGADTPGVYDGLLIAAIPGMQYFWLGKATGGQWLGTPNTNVRGQICCEVG